MIIVLYVMAGIFAALLLATLGFSSNWLATGIRGTVRQGVLGVTFFAPFAALLALFGVCVYAVIAGALYFYNM